MTQEELIAYAKALPEESKKAHLKEWTGGDRIYFRSLGGSMEVASKDFIQKLIDVVELPNDSEK